MTILEENHQSILIVEHDLLLCGQSIEHKNIWLIGSKLILAKDPICFFDSTHEPNKEIDVSSQPQLLPIRTTKHPVVNSQNRHKAY